MTYAQFVIRRSALSAIVLVLGAGGAAFGEEVSAGVSILRGTPPAVQQQPAPQKIIVAPPLPSCPNGYIYSPSAGYCYQLQDPTAARR